jgi:restriction system protein
MGKIVKKYFRVMLGSGSKFAQECLDNHFVGIDFGFNESLKPYMVGTWSEHKDTLKEAFIKYNPDKTPVGLGLCTGALSNFGSWLEVGDIVLCPLSTKELKAGVVVGEYEYVPGGILPHRRKVEWFSTVIPRADLSESMQNSIKSTNTLIDISKFASELEAIIDSRPADVLFTKDKDVEDPSAFAIEKHLEDFLIYNWANTELAKTYDLLTDEGEVVAQQYQSDTGPIDILVISKDKREYLVIELKKGRASDVVVGQILRYMGFVKNELAVNGESVRGIIIALDDDLRLRNAISMIPSVEFYRYEINFRLKPSDSQKA